MTELLEEQMLEESMKRFTDEEIEQLIAKKIAEQPLRNSVLLPTDEVAPECC